jgi:membrane-bound lytic murein transglycosylase D
MPLAELKRRNPELLRDITPSYVSEYSLRIPAAADEALLAGLERIPANKIPKYNEYRVRRGDSLYAIALRHRTTVAAIRRANGLRSNLIRPGMHLVIPYGGQ